MLRGTYIYVILIKSLRIYRNNKIGISDRRKLRETAKLGFLNEEIKKYSKWEI